MVRFWGKFPSTCAQLPLAIPIAKTLGKTSRFNSVFSVGWARKASATLWQAFLKYVACRGLIFCSGRGTVASFCRVWRFLFANRGFIASVCCFSSSFGLDTCIVNSWLVLGKVLDRGSKSCSGSRSSSSLDPGTSSTSVPSERSGVSEVSEGSEGSGRRLIGDLAGGEDADRLRFRWVGSGRVILSVLPWYRVGTGWVRSRRPVETCEAPATPCIFAIWVRIPCSPLHAVRQIGHGTSPAGWSSRVVYASVGCFLRICSNRFSYVAWQVGHLFGIVPLYIRRPAGWAGLAT